MRGIKLENYKKIVALVSNPWLFERYDVSNTYSKISDLNIHVVTGTTYSALNFQN